MSKKSEHDELVKATYTPSYDASYAEHAGQGYNELREQLQAKNAQFYDRYKRGNGKHIFGSASNSEKPERLKDEGVLDGVYARLSEQAAELYKAKYEEAYKALDGKPSGELVNYFEKASQDFGAPSKQNVMHGNFGAVDELPGSMKFGYDVVKSTDHNFSAFEDNSAQIAKTAEFNAHIERLFEAKAKDVASVPQDKLLDQARPLYRKTMDKTWLSGMSATDAEGLAAIAEITAIAGRRPGIGRSLSQEVLVEAHEASIKPLLEKKTNFTIYSNDAATADRLKRFLSNPDNFEFSAYASDKLMLKGAAISGLVEDTAKAGGLESDKMKDVRATLMDLKLVDGLRLDHIVKDIKMRKIAGNPQTAGGPAASVAGGVNVQGIIDRDDSAGDMDTKPVRVTRKPAITPKGAVEPAADRTKKGGGGQGF